MILCPECHSPNPANTLYCGKCGTRLHPPEEISITSTMTMETPVEELTTGITFAGRYQIIEVLGTGGMGKVYRALDKKLNEEVAFKLIKPEIASDRKTVERFSNELKLARKIVHKNIARMFDIGEEKGTHYFTMEYVRGEDLKSFIHRSGQLAIGATIRIAKQVCEGLSEAHKLGVVHRDLKPSNIMIDKEGDVRIMDFGIARSLEARRITSAGVMIGTPEYMSPEQVEGKEVDQRSDIYSLGVILYEMITGRVPFEGDTPITIGVKHKSEIPQNPKELNAQIPAELGGLILRCLEKDRDTRYQSAGELLKDLNNIEKGIPVTQKVIPQMRPITSKEITIKFDLKKAVIPTLVVLVVLFLSWYFFINGRGPAFDPNLVLVTVFDNQTEDESLDSQGRIAADSLSEGISQMEGIEVVPVSAVPEWSKESDEKRGSLQSIEQFQQLAKKMGAGIIITGAYYMVGLGLQFTAKITDAQTGKMISSVSSELEVSREPDKVYKPYIDIINDLQQRVMGVLAARRDPYMSGILSGRPPTYKAYQEYRLGWEYFSRDYDKSLHHFQRAHELDSSFIIPFYFISSIQENIGEYQKAQDVVDQMDQIREQLTEHDLFWFDHFSYSLQGNYQRALGVLRQAEKKLPNSFVILDTIGLLGIWLNRPQETLEAVSKLDMEGLSKWTMAPRSWSISKMITAFHMLRNYQKERETIQRAKELFLDRIWRHEEVRVLAALGKIEDVEKFVDESFSGLSKAGNPRSVAYEAVEELRVHGHTEEAQKIADKLVSWAQKQMPADPPEGQLRRLANYLYLDQRWDEADAIYKKLAEKYPDSRNKIIYEAKQGCIAARKGDLGQARQISEELGAIDQSYLFGEHSYQRACIASLLGEKQQAVDLLNQAMREGLEFGIYVIQEQDFLPLKDFLSFQEFIRPKG